MTSFRRGVACLFVRIENSWGVELVTLGEKLLLLFLLLLKIHNIWNAAVPGKYFMKIEI